MVGIIKWGLFILIEGEYSSRISKAFFLFNGSGKKKNRTKLIKE